MFWLFLNDQTIVQHLRDIIISTVYYSSYILIWSFSYHLCIVDCWPVCSHWSNQCSLILEFVLGCDCKCFVGHIETGNMCLLPPQVCGRSWWGCRFDDQTCSLQLISLLDLKLPSSYLFNTFCIFANLCVSYLSYHH